VSDIGRGTASGLAGTVAVAVEEGNPEVLFPERFSGFQRFVCNAIDEIRDGDDAEQAVVWSTTGTPLI
jgi:hypothetical protein